MDRSSAIILVVSLAIFLFRLVGINAEIRTVATMTRAHIIALHNGWLRGAPLQGFSVRPTSRSRARLSVGHSGGVALARPADRACPVWSDPGGIVFLIAVRAPDSRPYTPAWPSSFSSHPHYFLHTPGW